MRRTLSLKGLKLLRDGAVEFPRLAVLFGPNAGGNSNLLDAFRYRDQVAIAPGCGALSVHD